MPFPIDLVALNLDLPPRPKPVSKPRRPGCGITLDQLVVELGDGFPADTVTSRRKLAFVAMGSMR